MAFLRPKALDDLTLAGYGPGVLVSELASVHNAGAIRLGAHVRIDDFCLLSAGTGGIHFGNYIHLGAFSSIIGDGPVSVADFANISSRVSIYSSNDDYSGSSLTNPMIPEAFKNVTRSAVSIGKHVIIGCGAVILPGVELREGAVVGALSLVKESCEPFTIYAGVPAKPIGKRGKGLLDKEAAFKMLSDQTS